jgi:hypothetical protein
MHWYPRACPVCPGDLHDDMSEDGWVICMQCARSFPASKVPALERVATGHTVRQPEASRAV